MKRLGLNDAGYRGESLDVLRLLEDLEQVARARHWHLDRLAVAPGLNLLALQRGEQAARKRIYLSSGIHGDEPAGPLAMLQLLRENEWPGELAFWLCPCLNPEGFRINRRENETGIDLNRDYRDASSAAVRAHIDWLQRQPRFDLCLCLHEDWEANGFYLYEQNPDNHPSFAERIIAAVRRVCPVDDAPVIEGREAHGGIVRPKLSADSLPQWPEAFYLIEHKTRQTYTLEAPSDFPLSVRVDALVTGVKAALRVAAGPVSDVVP